jgi:hypothetical protein
VRILVAHLGADGFGAEGRVAVLGEELNEELMTPEIWLGVP